jgi:regulator of replication initiation timing
MFRVGIADRARADNGERPEDAVRRLFRLKKAVARARDTLSGELGSADQLSLAKRAGDAATEMALWEEELEQVRAELAELIAECDRWRIAHDKLRERIDRHALEPRTMSEPRAMLEPRAEEPVPRSAKIPTPPRPPVSSGESQDFSAIDRELERLNASMLAAFSSE